MDRKRLLFVFNPRSGKGQIRNRLVNIVDIFVKAGYEVVVHPTQFTTDAKRMVAKRAGEFDLVVCSGGDGTLDETVSGMMERENKVPIGYIPAGSTNDFAQTLHIPKDMIRAAEVAVKGRIFPCDVGSFNQDYFVYVAAFGLFTDVSYQTNQNLKNVFGHGAYILEGAKRLADVPSYKLRVEVNGKVITDNFIYGMISNSHYVGGVKNMGLKDAKLDDGLFEVSLIRYPSNPVQLNEILTNLMLPNVLDTNHVYHFTTSQIRVECLDRNVPWTLDGEFGGNHRIVEIHSNRQAVQLMVPKNDNGKKRLLLPALRRDGV